MNFYGDDNTVYEWDADDHCVKTTVFTAGTTQRSIGTVTSASDTPTVNITGTVDTAASGSLKGINIIKAMTVNTQISATGGQDLVAARTLPSIRLRPAPERLNLSIVWPRTARRTARTPSIWLRSST